MCHGDYAVNQAVNFGFCTSAQSDPNLRRPYKVSFEPKLYIQQKDKALRWFRQFLSWFSIHLVHLPKDPFWHGAAYLFDWLRGRAITIALETSVVALKRKQKFFHLFYLALEGHFRIQVGNFQILYFS